MYYVLKYNGLGPDYFLEHCYDEVISIKNRIALVKFEHNKNRLLGMQFEEIGMAENEEEAIRLLGGGKKDTVSTQVTSTPVIPKVPIRKIVSKDIEILE